MTKAAPPTTPSSAAGAIADLHGASRLAVAATLGVTGLVENLHRNIGRMPLGRVAVDPTRGVTGFVYRSIRGVTRLVGASLDGVLGPAAAWLAAGDETEPRLSSPERDAVVAALGGVLGDYLAATGNPLAITMSLRERDLPLPVEPAALALALPDARPRILLTLHGLCMGPRAWRRGDAEPVRALADAGDRTLLHLHYNTGLHVHQNGRLLADRLQALRQAWPVPLQDIVVVAHSMGGLVARSAVAQATASGDDWPARLSQMFFLGTPHHGAPLERSGRGLDAVLAASPYTAAFTKLSRLRSAGITDLRHGSLLEADAVAGGDRHASAADHRSPVPLPGQVACHAIAGALNRNPAERRERWLGDGLVPVSSATGRHHNPSMQLDFDPDRTRVLNGVGHIALLTDPAVWAQVGDWMDAATASPG